MPEESSQLRILNQRSWLAEVRGGALIARKVAGRSGGRIASGRTGAASIRRALRKYALDSQPLGAPGRIARADRVSIRPCDFLCAAVQAIVCESKASPIPDGLAQYVHSRYAAAFSAPLSRDSAPAADTSGNHDLLVQDEKCELSSGICLRWLACHHALQLNVGHCSREHRLARACFQHFFSNSLHGSHRNAHNTRSALTRATPIFSSSAIGGHAGFARMLSGASTAFTSLAIVSRL